jgi:hypothetical protein
MTNHSYDKKAKKKHVTENIKIEIFINQSNVFRNMGACLEFPCKNITMFY